MTGFVDTIKNTIAENVGGANAITPEQNKFTHEQVPDLSGKVAIVTGGSEGVGLAVTQTLLDKNISKVYIVSLDKNIADSAKDTLTKELGEEKASRLHWLKCDLADWDTVPGVAKQILGDIDRLDILVNNAARGIMTFQLTEPYGVDRHMAINSFGHMILTTHLLPLLKKTADDGSKVHVVNTASNAHAGTPSDTKFASLEELNQDIGPNPLYGRSKLAVLLYTQWLAKHLAPSHPNLLVNAIHPGIVETRQSTHWIHEPYPVMGYMNSVVLNPLKKTPMEGALSTLYAATVFEDTGKYICPPAAVEKPTGEKATDMQLAENLMKLAKEVITEKSKALNAEDGSVLPFY